MNLPEPEPEASTVDCVMTAVLVLAILGLLSTCGFLWAQAHDARMRANAEARVQIMEAEDQAARAKQEATLLREQLQELKAQFRQENPNSKINE